ncbi:MAG: DUF424 family protein [Nanoarchaeota archaeon]|nr:DUF424 family protein [Nanoarchaeota archaeon]
MICVKVHKSYREVVAICDSNLIGKKFEEGIKQLEVRESFYKDKELSYDETIELMQFQAREDASFNIVGQESLKAAKEAGIINDKGIEKIQNIPYALILS